MTSILPQQVPLRAARRLVFRTGQPHKASRSFTHTLALFGIGEKANSGKREQKKAEVGTIPLPFTC